MLLKALLLQAQVTGHVGATDLTHSVLEAASLLCQGKIPFVNIVFYQELFGPPGFLIARNKCSVRIVTLLY